MDRPVILDRPSFTIAGRKTYISGQDNDQFGRFWQECQAAGLMDIFQRLTDFRRGAVSGGTSLGVSRVEKDPARRDFDYMIAVEIEPAMLRPEDGLEAYSVPACRWAVFECLGPIPDAIVAAEIFAFSQWLPASGYGHALAPEMEVYLPDAPDGQKHSQFWLPLQLL